MERSGNGKSLLDKMYQSSLSYWKKQKEGLKDSSRFNKESSAKKPMEREADATMNVKSLLDVIHKGDDRSRSRRMERTQDCSGFNREQLLSEEKLKLKTKTIENYYKSLSKKVGDCDAVDYDGWTNGSTGVMHKINSTSQKLDQDRKVQLLNVGYKIKQQMEETTQKKREEDTKQRNFKETPLLVCSHKANLMYCNICNRKVPSNKISKVMADYAKKKGCGSKN